MRALLFSIVFLTVVSVPAFAEITNPQIVDSMTAQVIETGTLEISGSVNTIQLNLSIPQEDMYQRIESFSVSSNGAPCEGSCSYGFVNDEYGNRLLNIAWKSPKGGIVFEVRSYVSVSRRFSADRREYDDFAMPTNLVQSTDHEIASIAEGARGTDFEKVSYLSKWISENIRYNNIYSDINIPAKEILRLRIGVCKEFSNLLVSFLRSMGYYSAVDVGYVHPGKVYSGGNFEPHGWVETYTDEGGIISDPTWGEVGYLDATHIKFATLPDSKWTFTSAYSAGLGTFKVNVVNTSVSIDLISYEEKPLLESSSKLLDDGLSRGYAVLQTDMSSDHCILTKMDVMSCGSQDGQFLTRLNTGNITYFCGNKSMFTIFKLPELEKGVQYTCPISVMVYGSEQEIVSLTLSHGSEGSTRLSVDKTTASPNERLTATAQGSHIFTSDGDIGYGTLEFGAPYNDFTIYSYSEGALDQQRISVVSSKPVDAAIIYNGSAHVGSESTFIVDVKNLMDQPQTVSVRFGSNVKTESVDNSKNFVFSFTPTSQGDNLLRAVVSSGDYSTSVSVPIEVAGDSSITGVLSSFFGGIAQAVSGFFGRIAQYFG